MFENILVVFFTFENTEHVTSMAFSIAKKYEAKVDVLKCIYKEPPKFVVFETKSEKKQHQQRLADAQDSIKPLEAIAKESGLSFQSEVVFTEELSEYVTTYVKSNKVDLLIMDTSQHHEGEDNKDLVNRIYKEIDCPTLTLK